MTDQRTNELAGEAPSSAVAAIRLFGGVSAEDEAGNDLDVGPAKCQAVLAALALAAGAVVPVSRLIDMVWGEDAPRTADKTLQSYVTRLRKTLGSEAILRVGAAYRLDIEPHSVDVVRFQRLIESGDVRAALDEWVAAPLAGLEADGFAGPVEGLTEQWLSAVEGDLESRIDEDTPSALARLTELTAEYPFRENLWALLMTALYRVDRQAEALAAYRTARTHLIEELGVEPGPRLRELEARILAHDADLTLRERSAPADSIPTGTVTFAFTDIDDIGSLWSGHRAEAAAAVERHDEIVHKLAGEHGGHIHARTGVSFGVAFGRASTAIRWSTALHRAIADDPLTRRLGLRTGVSTGETEERGSNYFGAAVQIAERLGSLGHAGQIVVSGATAALLEPGATTDLGSHRLDRSAPDQRLHQIGAEAFPPLRTDSTRGNLPRRVGRMIGRESELSDVLDALRTSPVVTLVGAGGIGKTRLAIGAARLSMDDFDDGAWLIELAGVSASGDVARAAADVLDIAELPTRTMIDSVVSSLEDRNALLVIDNCEHVVDGAAELANAISVGCPHVTVLATSREGLGLRPEQLLAVAPLEPDGPGVELFTERALAVSPTFDLEEHRGQVTEICHRLDGVPLAIELAAARIRTMNPADLLERLDDRLRLLSGGRLRSVERHRTMRATIEWSYELLTPAEQEMFASLSIFLGSFDLAAAQAIADPELDPLDVDELLSSLIDRSMLTVQSGTPGRRFRMLETMRHFGADHLMAAGRTSGVARAHAEWCREEITDIGSMLLSQNELEAVARLEAIWPDVRGAVDFACASDDHALAQALVRPVVGEPLLRSQGEISSWIEQVLQITPPEDLDDVAFFLLWAAHRYMARRDVTGYEALHAAHGSPDHPYTNYALAIVRDRDDEIVDLAPLAARELRSNGEEKLAGFPDMWACGSRMSIGLVDGLAPTTDELVHRFRITGPPSMLSWSLIIAGYATLFENRVEDAEALFDESASIQVPPRTPSFSKPIRARAAFRRGDELDAIEILRSYTEELLELDQMAGASHSGIEYVNTMVKLGKEGDAAYVLGYLDGIGVTEGRPSPFLSMIEESITAIETSSDDSVVDFRRAGATLDHREALEHMITTLRQSAIEIRGAAETTVAR
ncbi:MAG: AfsR/SARP family transcriptional regulator [Acidimicrobiales bacterium]